jgi:predicted O-methyltransferase YrrM
MLTRRVRGALRARGRRVYDRNRLARELVTLARWPKLRKELPDLAHIALYEELSVGPVQRDEALLLHALVRVLRPQTVLEIGFFHGHSAFNFLRALDADARLYSIDVDPACAETASSRFGDDPRFVFRVRSQEELTRDDLDGRLADFVFFDGAHDLSLNQAAFERLRELIAPRAVIAIHDTGAIPRAFVPPGHWTMELPDQWSAAGYEHQPDERAFVNWLLDAHPEYSQIHLHSARTVRHGVTLLQRSAPLERPA